MKRFLFIVAIFLCLALAACQAAAAPADAPQPQVTSPVVAGALFEVVLPDGTSMLFTVDQAKKIPLGQLMAEGKVEEGPRLLEVLKLSGVTDFTQVTVTGSSGSAVLKKDQIGDDTVLDFTNHGTVKLASPVIPKADWVKDVSLIEVK